MTGPGRGVLSNPLQKDSDMGNLPKRRRPHNGTPSPLPLLDYGEGQRVRAATPAPVRRWARALGLPPRRAALVASLAGIGPEGGAR